jgi:DNA adenine methylase
MLARQTKNARPFLKWVGGKKQLLPSLREYYPKEYGKYFEPFLGGGAVFYDLQPKQALLNDINISLIGAYKDIKSQPQAVIKELRKLSKKYSLLSVDERKEFYYSIREKFNIKTPSLLRTAYLIFLNKTCFNGMYRENSSGGFNVPFGTYKNPKILDEENILAVSSLLSKATLLSGSFKEAVKSAKKGDFIYFDPPYYPVTKTANFTSYNSNGFLEKEQEELRDLFVELDKKGCFVMLSNSYSDYISKLYKGYEQNVVTANRAINSKGSGRGKVKEYLILNYKP